MNRSSLDMEKRKLNGVCARIPRGVLALIPVLLIVLSGGTAMARSGAPEDKTYSPDMTKCAGFGAQDAAQILNLPAAKLTAKIEKMTPALWRCGFTAPDGKGISFSVTISKNARAAAEEMDDLRENLELTAETAPFRNKLPQGAYSEILNLGDESVWTDVNGTLTVRKGNVSIQVLMPSGKKEQIKIVQAFLAKLL